MARKDVFKNALESLIKADPAGPRTAGPKSILQAAALGAVDTGLARSLQLVELEPAQIGASEFADRLPYETEDLADLIESMRSHGQQIPILVQRDGMDSYRVIYGRRRLAAARSLGIKIRALVTQMDDQQRIIAQGVENTVRRDLSFIEKALFAHRLRLAGVEETVIRQALNIDVGAPKATTISTMKMVVETLGVTLLEAIGRAPGIGRPRWRAMAELYRVKSAQFADANLEGLTACAQAVLADPSEELEASDLRFAAVFAHLSGLGTAVKPAVSAAAAPSVPLRIKRGKDALTLRVQKSESPAFHAWLDQHADDLVRDILARFEQETTPQPKQEAR